MDVFQDSLVNEDWATTTAAMALVILRPSAPSGVLLAMAVAAMLAASIRELVRVREERAEKRQGTVQEHTAPEARSAGDAGDAGDTA